jgi:hypothetical protein
MDIVGPFLNNLRQGPAGEAVERGPSTAMKPNCRGDSRDPTHLPARHLSGVPAFGPIDSRPSSSRSPAIVSTTRPTGQNAEVISFPSGIVPFGSLGLAAVIAGGLIAAATARAPSETLVWLVAYLVLIVGVAQIALGVGQYWLAGRAPERTGLWGEFAAFNLGNAGVIVGTLIDVAPLVDAGGVLVVVALILFLMGGRGASRGGGLRHLYRFLILLLLISVPIGLLLAHSVPG